MRARYPSWPGWKRRATAAAAADSVAPTAKSLRHRALAAFRGIENEMTADEVAEALGEGILSIRPRIAELAAMGKLEDVGTRRKNVSGRAAIVWRRRRRCTHSN